MAGFGRQDEHPQWRVSRAGAALTGVGVSACIAGFAGGHNADGTAAQNWGILAGIGLAMTFTGLVKVWIDRQVDLSGYEGGRSRKRERLQSQRAWQLWTLPVATLIMLAMAIQPARDILAGEVVGRGYYWLGMPVLYGWVITMITMGWDGNSRKNRRFLEDELTRVLRTRALTTAFVVLMTGVTVALMLGLARPLLGILALPFVLAAAGATAGIRFAWLDREAGKDG